MLGLKLYLIGIGIQEAIVVYTLALAVVIQRGLKTEGINHPTATKASDQRLIRLFPISYGLFFSIGAISIRNAYRLIELSAVFTGYLLALMHNEIFFYTLECFPTLAALGVWLIVDTEGLLNHASADSRPGIAYRYHEIGGEAADDDAVPLHNLPANY